MILAGSTSLAASGVVGLEASSWAIRDSISGAVVERNGAVNRLATAPATNNERAFADLCTEELEDIVSWQQRVAYNTTSSVRERYDTGVSMIFP